MGSPIHTPTNTNSRDFLTNKMIEKNCIHKNSKLTKTWFVNFFDGHYNMRFHTFIGPVWRARMIMEELQSWIRTSSIMHISNHTQIKEWAGI